MQGPVVVTVLAAVYNEHRVTQCIVIFRWLLIIRGVALGQAACVLTGALGVFQAAAPPKAAALRAIAACQRETTATKGDPGAGPGADAEGTPGKH